MGWHTIGMLEKPLKPNSLKFFILNKVIMSYIIVSTLLELSLGTSTCALVWHLGGTWAVFNILGISVPKAGAFGEEMGFKQCELSLG